MKKKNPLHKLEKQILIKWKWKMKNKIFVGKISGMSLI